MKNIEILPTPTKETYTGLEEAFDHFNETLFEKKLPYCLLTLQRERKTQGYYSPKRFFNPATNEFTDEIALNPEYFGQYPLLEAFQTLVHEMVHLWQEHFGNPGRRRYHNKEWANKMVSIGLIPTSTGRPGGKMTGDCISDYAADDGIFIREAEKLSSNGYELPWIDRYGLIRAVNSNSIEENSLVSELLGSKNNTQLASTLNSEDLPVTSKDKTKYTHNCSGNICNVWGKPSLNIACGDCGEPYNKL